MLNDANFGAKLDYRTVMNNTFAKDTKDEFEYYLEHFGGNFNLGYGFHNIFESQSHRTGWSRFLDVIQNEPKNQNAINAIKYDFHSQYSRVSAYNKQFSIVLKYKGSLEVFQ